MREWDWLLTQKEGQFFERKSCYDRSSGRATRRDVRSMALDVAESLSAMANADGGTVAIGIEDDGTPSGVDYPSDRLEVILNAPTNRVIPPLHVRRHDVDLDGINIVVLEVDPSPEVHRLSDGRYLRRIGDQNLPMSAADIEALQAATRRRLVEMGPVPEATVGDLDKSLLDELRDRLSSTKSDEDLLLGYRLAEQRTGRIVLSRAALLLLGAEPDRWHPRCGIDFVKYEGTERQFGAELNIVKRERLESPLPRLIELAYDTIQPHLRERQRLVDLFFKERFEYPVFAWQEAIVNAVAHRDYSIEGASIEVWIFDDRMEIQSPGSLLEPVTLEALQRGQRTHVSRNPRIVRVLTDLGYMRELGEGIPRMIREMEREGLNRPEFKVEDGTFGVILRNTPIYDEATRLWLISLEHLRLNPDQKRLLAYARAHGGRFTSRAYQKLVGVDIYRASRDIKDLVRRGMVRLTRKGGRVYELFEPARQPAIREEWTSVVEFARREGFIANRHVQSLLSLSRAQAYKTLQQMVDMDILKRKGRGRGTVYLPAENASLSAENASR